MIGVNIVNRARFSNNNILCHGSWTGENYLPIIWKLKPIFALFEFEKFGIKRLKTKYMMSSETYAEKLYHVTNSVYHGL